VKASQSEFIRIRGIDLHCRLWGPAGAPKLFLLHGNQDVSASWQFTVDAFAKDWCVIAPDWRGNGLSGWSGADSYWFPDYLGDLHALLDHYSPQQPVRLVGHSMGASIGALYSGVAADRVARFVNVDGFGPPGSRQDPAPRRIAKWLAQLGEDTAQRPYESFEEFALRMQSENPRLTDARARFLVEHWGRQEPDGSVVRRADPAHKRINPLPIPYAAQLACWRQTTRQRAVDRRGAVGVVGAPERAPRRVRRADGRLPGSAHRACGRRRPQRPPRPARTARRADRGLHGLTPGRGGRAVQAAGLTHRNTRIGGMLRHSQLT
jgi:pimeloyl-ACP methyl ester carboxylesterase